MQHEMLIAAEMKHDDRRNRLGAVIQKVDGDLHLREFLMWIFNVTGGGLEGSLQKSFIELGYRPWGLCCSRSKARSTVNRAVELGIVSKEETTGDNGQQANKYSIDWDGVSDLLCAPARTQNERGAELGPRASKPSQPFQSSWSPEGIGDPDTPAPHRWVGSERPGGEGLRDPACIKHSPETPLRTPPGTGTGGGALSGPAQQWGANSVSTGMAETGAGAIALPGAESGSMNFSGALRICFDDWPVLLDLLDIPVPSAPLKHVQPGLTMRFFRDDFFKVRGNKLEMGSESRRPFDVWFREQLSLPRPVFPGNAACFALVHSAADDARRKPLGEIKTTRARYFVNTISKGFWQRSMYRLPAALDYLQESGQLFPGKSNA